MIVVLILKVRFTDLGFCGAGVGASVVVVGAFVGLGVGRKVTIWFCCSFVGLLFITRKSFKIVMSGDFSSNYAERN